MYSLKPRQLKLVHAMNFMLHFVSYLYKAAILIQSNWRAFNSHKRFRNGKTLFVIKHFAVISFFNLLSSITLCRYYSAGLERSHSQECAQVN